MMQKNQTDQHKSSCNNLFIIDLKSSATAGSHTGQFGYFFFIF